MCVSWHTSKVKTFDDMLTTPFVVGGQGPSSDANLFASLLRSVFGAKTQIVSGYPGTNEISLAMERGEVEGRCGWAWGSVKVSRADWLATKKINVILQIALQPAPDLPGVPLIMDLARNDAGTPNAEVDVQPPTDGMAVCGAAGFACRQNRAATCGL